MRKHGVQMWIVACREYAEDPVFFSLVSPTMMFARRTTIYVFNDRGEAGGVERLALGGGSNDGLYTVFRDPANPNHEIYGDEQWQVLRRLIEQRKPATIAIDVSHTHAFSDGLTSGLREALDDALGPKWMSRVVHAENLALEYQELRVPEMLPVYRQMMQIVHSLINRAFSSEVITPGKTTDQDVVWWLRQKVNDMGFGTWFHPSVRIQRPGKSGLDFLNGNSAKAASGGAKGKRNSADSAAGSESVLREFLERDKGVVIERGDVLHTDFGITAMRLNTDTQHMGYVLRDGETDVPEGIRKALENGKRLQDLVLTQMKPGRSGNEVLASALDAMKTEGISGSIYSHPIGDRGHAAGPFIGLWDRQQGVPGRGDVLLLPGTWFSIELSADTPVPEWNNQPLFIGLEEDVVLDESGRVSWVAPRQERYHLVQ